MLDSFREDFNTRFAPEAYNELCRSLRRATRTEIEFPIAETPVFFSRELIEEMAGTGIELTRRLLANSDYLQAAQAAIPAAYRIAGDTVRPQFMTVDFGLVRRPDGRVVPTLVELQAFPSVYGFQPLLANHYIEHFRLSPQLGFFLGGHTEESYWARMREIILGQHAPEQVVLTEVEPQKQKTLPDFRVHEERLGIPTVDISKLRKDGGKLFYQKPDAAGRGQGPWIPISRIYNRAIADEMQRKRVQSPFPVNESLDVEWAGHPNWYFKLSKFSLPWLQHPAVPSAVFLHEWMDDVPGGPVRSRIPELGDRLLLKPLYGFAGRGIEFGPSKTDLERIPTVERSSYLLQERVQFEPVIRTPFGMTQAEIRIMYLWGENTREMEPVIGLARLGRGQMMGVDHNKGQPWVGGSALLFPR